MRILALAVFLSVIALGLGSAAAVPPPNACFLCVCANDEFACGEAFTDVIDEQGVCSSLCSMIGSSGTSGPQLIEASCSDLPQCGSVGAPAAGTLWLSAGVVGLLSFGGWTIRRARSRRTA
jgi:hypothetical protein